MLRLLRPKQWTKNLLLFAALLFAERLLDPSAVLEALLAFVAFCLASSSVYVVNDLVDVERDRAHPEKRHRPLASGQVSPGTALVLTLALSVSSLALAFWLGRPFGNATVVYLCLSHFYTFVGKNVVLLWYPLDWSPTCEKENCKISAEPILTGDDTVVVGISRDSTWSHAAWKAAKGISHDLLADPMLEVTKQYGMEHPAVPFISHRATVIIDKDGKVAFSSIQENTKEERDWQEVQTALAAL